MSDSQSSLIEPPSGGPPFGGPQRPVFATSATSTSTGSATSSQFADPEGPEGDPAPLRGRLAVITGGAGLLGAAMAAELGARGADICLMGHDADELRRVLSTLGDGVRSMMLRGDLATESEVLAAVDFVERIDRPVDLLIHAAGLQAPATIATGPVEGLDEHYLLNVRGPYLLTQKLLGSLAATGGQVVFFTASESAATEPAPGDAHHTISQAGMQAFATELRVEAARSGIRVLTVDAVAQTWTEVSGVVGGPSGQTLLTALARSVVDTLVERGVDVTELRVRQPSGSARTERR